jgi:type IV pilus assembly protein PilQ
MNFLTLFCATFLLAHQAHAVDDRLTANRFGVNVQNTDVSNLLALVAAQTGLQLKADPTMAALVTMNQKDATGKEILDRLTQDQQIDYSVVGNQLIVTKRAIGVSGATGNVHHVKLKFLNATDAAAKLTAVVPASEKLIVDEQENSLMFVGSEATWGRVSQVVSMMDVIPLQVLIEAQIVETSNNFLRDLGIALSGRSNNGRHDGEVTATITQTANLAYSGLVTGKAMNLDLKINAAETKGDAKVVSRPKVLTLNNKKAHIESGTTFNVRTLSTAISNPTVPGGGSSTGTPGLSATTGVTSINAGLTLDILPTVIDSDTLRMVVTINNSEADESNVVDGIPSIRNNAASTTIIVKSGETAVIAGLVKQTNSKSKTGVPFLSSIPVLGVLFRTDSQIDRNNELTIFLTPTIENGHVKVSAAAPAGGAMASVPATQPN